MIVRKTELAYEEAKSTKKDSYAIKQAALDIELARLQLSNLKQEYIKGRLLSPVEGVVDSVGDFGSGDFIEINKWIIRMVEDKNLQLVYSGEHSDDFKPEMKVKVKVDGKVYKGVVESVAKGPQGGGQVTFYIDGLDMSGIEIGDYANIEVVLNRKDDTIVLPNNVVHEYGGRRFVKVLEDGIQAERYVETGITTPSQTEIVSGLKVGEKVIE